MAGQEELPLKGSAASKTAIRGAETQLTAFPWGLGKGSKRLRNHNAEADSVTLPHLLISVPRDRLHKTDNLAQIQAVLLPDGDCVQCEYESILRCTSSPGLWVSEGLECQSPFSQPLLGSLGEAVSQRQALGRQLEREAARQDHELAGAPSPRWPIGTSRQGVCARRQDTEEGWLLCDGRWAGYRSAL